MPWSCVGAQQGLGTVSGLIKWTWFGGKMQGLSGREGARRICRVPSDTYQRLHDGVIGGVHVGVQREGAFTVAVVGRIALRSDDPVLVSEATHTLGKYHFGLEWDHSEAR